jgi:universal stress protein E
MNTSYFQNILVGTDFSECAAAALETAVSIARRFNAKLTVAHVVGDVAASFAMLDYGTGWQAMPEDFARLKDELRADAQRRLSELVAKYRTSGVEIATGVLVGVPYVAIIEAVKQSGFDLVIVGTRGMSAIKRVWVGSTATRLARICPAPVWVAREHTPVKTQPILVAVDFSAVTNRLLSIAGSLASALGAAVHLLHAYDVEELYGVPPLSDDTRAELSLYRRFARRAALERMGLLESEVNEHGSASLHVAQGVPYRVINATARRIDAGLIMMGSVGRRGVSGLLIGNTAEKILHTSDRSLLVVKPETPEAKIPMTAETSRSADELRLAAASAATRGW